MAVFQLFDDPAGDQLHFRGGAGEVQVFAAVQDRRTCRSDMDFFGSAVVQEFGGLTQLGAADNGVVDEQQALAFDQVVDRDQLHFRDQVPFALDGRHEGAGPGGGVLNKGAGEGNP